MERRKFIQAGIVGTASFGLLSCTTEEKFKTYGPVIHSVYFWLREDLNESEKDNFVEFFEELKSIEAIQTLKYGKPAPANPRPVVDNSFSYNLIVSFANMEDLNIYEDHPVHLAAIEKFKNFWVKVEVRDTML